jgi:hypothetical protein
LLFFWLFTISLLVSLIAVPWVIVRLPADYFQRGKPRRPPFADYSAPVRMVLIVGKNLLGLALVGIGLVFLLMPGQGVIVILIGVLLLDFPRKKHLERWLISRGPILKLANWLRTKWNKEPLRVD